MSSKFYLTTPLYYVNAEPHIGHAYTTVLADVLTRYQRLFGKDVHFLTGNDEHGQKVADAAAKLGVDPIVHCDETSQRFKDTWDNLGIKYDDYIRTTEERHKKVVVDILQKLWDKGDIYKKDYEGFYSVYEEQFFTEKDLVDGKDPINHRPVELIKETNYFFKMSKYQDWLIDHYTQNRDAVIPEFRLNEVLGFLRQPLNDLCISRPKSRLSWGIPIPWDDDYVTYVWFDALLNYYSATLTPPEGTSPQWPADFHLIGKDILTTHAVYWPTMLKAAGLEPPKHILAHGWWLIKDSKMSKSEGNVVRPMDMADKYGADSFRYVLMRDMVVGQDANFSEESYIKRCNSDLANDLGNLVNRLTKLVSQYFDSEIQDFEITDEDEIAQLAMRTANVVRNKIDALKIHEAIEETLQFVRAINRIVSEAEPWKLAKTDKEAAGEVLTRGLEGIRIATLLLAPVIPQKSAEILERIGSENSNGFIWENTEWGKSLVGHKIQFGDPIFPRVQVEKPKQEQQPKKEKKKNDKNAILEEKISFDDFKKVDLRTAKVLEAEPVPDTDKLMRLQIDLGSEKRQLVAGVAQHYTPEEMVGKTIIVIANLEPAKIRGVESQGMLLAVREGKDLRLLQPNDEVSPGQRIS